MSICYAIIWGMIYCVDFDNYEAEENKFHQILKQKVCQIYVSFPIDHSVINYYIDLKLKRFRSWENLLPTYVHDASTSFYSIVVPTVDSFSRCTNMISLLKNNMHVIAFGNSGSGKSTSILKFQQSVDKNVQVYNFNFSFETGLNVLHDMFLDQEKFAKYRVNLVG